MRGDKGEKGDNLQIDIVINNESNLIENDEVNKFALIKFIRFIL